MIPLNITPAVPITHIMLFDTETSRQIQELCDNASLVFNKYKILLMPDSSALMGYKYKLVIATPEAGHLANECEKTRITLQDSGMNVLLALLKNQDMFAEEGKIAMFSCLLWRMSGAVLLNETPLSPEQTEKLLIYANMIDKTGHHLALFKKGIFQTEHRIGLIRSSSSLDPLLRGNAEKLQEEHSISDMIKLMKRNCPKKDLYLIR